MRMPAMLWPPCPDFRFLFGRQAGLPCLRGLALPVRLDPRCQVSRQGEGPHASISDGTPKGGDVVVIARQLLWLLLFSIHLRRLHLGLPFLAHDPETLGFGLLRAKKAPLQVGFEERFDNLLSTGAKVNLSPMTVVLSFVGFGYVNPDSPARVQVACAHGAHFTGTSTGQQL